MANAKSGSEDYTLFYDGYRIKQMMGARRLNLSLALQFIRVNYVSVTQNK